MKEAAMRIKGVGEKEESRIASVLAKEKQPQPFLEVGNSGRDG